MSSQKRKRPTISLALIAKNEEKNIERLIKSVEGCFDQIVLVDTGSTDKTVEKAKELGCEVHHFEWVNSFCKARNYAFSKCTKDYIMWMDLDDILHNKEGFIKWRDYAMEFMQLWFATYNYALDQNGQPIVSFVRERVFKRDINPTWRYDLHEGVMLQPGWRSEYAVTWAVNHLRTAEDMAQDKNRNLSILENIKDKDGRLTFYYGKELWEADKPHKAMDMLEQAVKMPDLELHDRLLAYQYGAYAATKCGDQTKDELVQVKQEYYKKAVRFCIEGINLDPSRAELHVAGGDVFLKMNDLKNAIPFYAAAKHCLNPKAQGSPYEGALYSFANCYGELPSLQLSKIYFTMGRMDEAKAEAKECFDKYKSPEAKIVLDEIEKIAGLITVNNNQPETTDIVFSCPPQNAYPFDEELYYKKGMGGSETALIEMSMHLKKLSPNRRVIVFNQREEDLVAKSGVEWLSNKKLNEYFSKNKPHVHIAWRHNIKLTNARTYLWCHDLVTPSVEAQHNFDKLFCLTNFHKNYVQAKQGVPEEKIVVTRNGISPSKFEFEKKPKNLNKLVWMSSPDRGLDRAMLVCDEVRKEFPDVELHVYYGLENLYKYGYAQLAQTLDAMMKERPYVKYHGFTEQNKMYQEVSDAVIWCHPCNFIETFCITALEMLALGVYPVTHRLGGLQDTLSEAEKNGQAVLLDHDCVTKDEIMAYVNEVKLVLSKKLWENVNLDIKAHSWESIAKEWYRMFEL